MYYIYLITNRVNSKTYIGQSKDITKRWSDHRRAVLNNNPKQIVHHAMIKYGLNDFVFEVIFGSKTQDDINWAEEYFIQHYDSTNSEKGYNLTNGGSVAPKTEEWKRKVSEKLMGHEVTQETRDKVSRGNTGKVRTDEFKKNVGEFHKGKIVSEETREKLSTLNKGNRNWLGKKHTDESKQKVSKANKGRRPAEITIQKSLEKTKGRTWKLVGGKRVWMDK